MSVWFKFGTDGWYCVTKGKIRLFLFLFLCEGFFSAIKFNLWKGFLS